ncbi:Crp/Fnr family transcriptional regulator [Jannaschia sp. W003]|uniref:Crp/Fnr family transcriptional regulator n=1 Tax=Jannaschia sp. W003 TaxID=2867012 RepID=UPI0021A8E022|nr:Crp/Fnr family transcriptional regulator [Jannaschia sp. W003]UWQ23110.1 Crp/Fnr family transcriptional regulator [Jannaschia sp. W003]
MTIAERTGLLLGAMPPRIRRALIAGGRRRHWPEGASIYVRGAPGGSMILIETGRARIGIVDAAGRETILNFMGPGEVMGEIALLDAGPRSADADAATDVTGVEIDRAAVLRMLAADPEGGLALVAELCAKLRNLSEMAEMQAQPSGAARLARCLLRLADRWDETDADGRAVIGGGLSQGDLGAYAGLSRETVNRLLRRWAAQGTVARGAGGLIVLRDRAALAALAA